MCPARNAHCYHPVTELHEPREICLHRCNARSRRVMHHPCVSGQRVAQDCCALQRGALPAPAGAPATRRPGAPAPRRASGRCQHRSRPASGAFRPLAVAGGGSAGSPGRRLGGSPARRVRRVRRVASGRKTDPSRPARGMFRPLAEPHAARPARSAFRRAARAPGRQRRGRAKCRPRACRPAVRGTSATARRRVVRPRHPGGAAPVRTASPGDAPVTSTARGPTSCAWPAPGPRSHEVPHQALPTDRSCDLGDTHAARRATSASDPGRTTPRERPRAGGHGRTRAPDRTAARWAPRPAYEFAAASASARNRIRCASMSTSCRWISARRSACSFGSARCNCPSSDAFRASRSRSTSATTMLRA